MILIHNFSKKGINNYQNYFLWCYRATLVAIVTRLNLEAFRQYSAALSSFAVKLVIALMLELLILIQYQLLNHSSSFSVGQPEYAA